MPPAHEIHTPIRGPDGYDVRHRPGVEAAPGSTTCSQDQNGLPLLCSGCVRNGLLCSLTIDDSGIDNQKSFTTTKHPRVKREEHKSIRARVRPATLSSALKSSILDRWKDDGLSGVLFEHYSCKTADQICGVTGPGNPFITYILPLAHADSLVMHGVLALSGVHLIHRTENGSFKSATWTHYGLAIRGLKEALTKIDKKVLDEAEAAQMLAATLLLCHVEAVSGNTNGAICHHLRASRQFAQKVLESSSTRLCDDFRTFLLELYAYLVLVGNITNNLGPLDREIPFDDFLFSLESLGNAESFGPMLGCAHGLFQLIPRVCQLGFECQWKQREGISSSSAAFEYTLLEAKIEKWQPPAERYDAAEVPSELLAAGQIYQYALLGFLHTIYYGPDVTNPELLSKVDVLIQRLFHVMSEDRWRNFDQPTRTPAIATTLLWPYIILGSCMRDPEHQIRIRSLLSRSPFEMTIVQRVLQLLEWLWADSSEYAYGPHGLEIMMRKHNMNICMA
ncbi:uncharacterized protein PAC_06001 [Phialocephala subalpina]|uniref:Uncharacterized protein n=1 Tax=Phialocephala subalpina TaxID=576137 RepID=A0A1L7WTP1_9HELO|nr:uncharacterized protein PAC_06001 [Phialocephala subalpina]